VLDLQRLRDEIDTLRRSASEDEAVRSRLAQLEADRTALESSLSTGAQRLEAADRTARARAAELLTSTPQQFIGGLGDDTPILLLPVRLETRFAQGADGSFLRLRIFPDDVAIAQHEQALTVDEADAGQLYWRELCRANAESDTSERERRARGAWNLLAGRYGAFRASWTARATRPTNWSDQLTDPAAATFPPLATKPLAWSETPRSFVLPDRFVVRLYAGGSYRDILGALIPDDLALGPDPLQAEGVFSRDETTGRLVIDDAWRWLVDFDAAVQVGMAVRIPLELPREAPGFDRIVVLGLRFSSGPDENAALVRRLLEAQRFSRGLSLIPQGTPTNNTDGAKSGLATGDQSIEEGFALERDPETLTPETDHFRKTDGQRLAEALGLPLDLVSSLPASRGMDAAEALAMNRALWSATLGDFTAEMLVPVMGQATIAQLRRFVGAYVAGRGLVSALRVGTQPYGVLVASALALWEWTPAETGDEAGFWSALLARLRTLDGVWRGLVSAVSYVGKAGDPFPHLLAVIGLQASSVEFYARKAIARDYLNNYTRFRGTPQAYATALWEEMGSAVAANLSVIGIDPAAGMRLRELVFWREHDLLTGPLIDDDPRVPFSETRGLTSFDGKRNYIDWLRTASSSDIRQQNFRDSLDQPLPPPAALLYRLLRDAFVAELGRAGRGLVQTIAPQVFAELGPEPVIVNVGASRTFTSADVLSVDAARIGAATSPISVADLLVAGARAVSPGGTPPPEAAGLADLHAALGLLAPLPTARLERLFAEHVDLCSYRLDAWVHGLFARRLWQLRQHQPSSLHLGAFGVVEDVRPSSASRRVVPPDQLPAPIRAGTTGAVMEDGANGGYVHAPSLTHAVTAAVLHNGYLSHAEPAQADTMAVNLSSTRVRTALGFLDGLRSGQELAALLGYQLERGLHEGHPGVELDQFIYVLRERFPLTSRKLTDVPAGTTAETMEARNVVNGYDLLDWVRERAYPYDIAGLSADGPEAGEAPRAQAAAIRQEIDKLTDAMDTIADLLLAESVHQVVQGNYDRARGVVQAFTEGVAPPDLQVVETPRSGRSLTFRIALPLDPSRTDGWQAELTPRAAANAALNHWLSTVLPPAAGVQWRVTEGTGTPTFVSLESLELEPLDCVLAAGERLGDLSGELERYLVHDYRVRHTVPDAMLTFLDAKSDPSVSNERALIIELGQAEPGRVSLASVFPLLKVLRQLVSASRNLHARDFELPTEAQETEIGNPKGLDDGLPPLKDLADLKTRVERAHTRLTSANDTLRTFMAGTILPLYDRIQADPTHAIGPEWSDAVAQLRRLLVAVCRFGIPEALPTAGLDVTGLTMDAIVAQAQTVVSLVTSRLATARASLDTTFTDPLPVNPDEAARARAVRTETLAQRYADAARSLLGSSFVVLPLFRVHASARPELASALASPISTDPLAIEEWLQSLVRVRPAPEAVGRAMWYGEWLDTAGLRLSPLQLPVRAGDAWIGTAFGDQLSPGDVASIVLCAAMPSLAEPLSGLLLDEWTELVPTAEQTTGIAFHFNRPNAVAPQALLLAVSPRLRGGWSWEDLVTVIVETFERARSRAVEPDMIAQIPYFQALPAILSEFSSAGLRFNLFAQSASAIIAPAGPPA